MCAALHDSSAHTLYFDLCGSAFLWECIDGASLSEPHIWPYSDHGVCQIHVSMLLVCHNTCIHVVTCSFSICILSRLYRYGSLWHLVLYCSFSLHFIACKLYNVDALQCLSTVNSTFLISVTSCHTVVTFIVITPRCTRASGV